MSRPWGVGGWVIYCRIAYIYVYIYPMPRADVGSSEKQKSAIPYLSVPNKWSNWFLKILELDGISVIRSK